MEEAAQGRVPCARPSAAGVCSACAYSTCTKSEAPGSIPGGCRFFTVPFTFLMYTGCKFLGDGCLVV